MSSLAVTIVNHGQWQWLAPCLDSLQAFPYTNGPFEVIVLDNASDDGSATELPHRFPDVRFLPQDRRRGFGANQNVAIATTEADVVLVLNPDTIMHESSIDRLVATMDANEAVVLAGGPILNEDGSVWSDAPLRFPTPGRVVAQALGIHRLAPTEPPGGTHPDHWLSGAAFLVRRQAFAAVGGFDEAFFLYGEETDLMRRLLAGGSVAAWVPDAPVTHVGRTATGPIEVRTPGPAAVELVRGQVRYAAKHHGAFGAALTRAGLGLDALIRWGLTLVGLGVVLEAKGSSVAATRAYHRGRLVAAWAPGRASGLAEQAEEWNATH